MFIFNKSLFLVVFPRSIKPALVKPLIKTTIWTEIF